MRDYYVYITTNRSMTLYIGVTNDIERRMNEHKGGVVEGFTSKYNIFTLIYLERCSDVSEAIAREKQIKKWRRSKKLQLIQSLNPRWEDLQRDFSTTLEMTVGDNRVEARR